VVLLPWAAHLYTALGAVAALLATVALFANDFRAAFFWLGVQIFIDSTDGLLARALRVKERLPWFDGALLDNIIDYITYAFIPVLIILRADLLPGGWALFVGSAILIASGYGFSRTDAKVEVGGAEHFFTGFPSYWNIVAFYLYVFRLAPAINAAILLVLALFVFVPLRYVYPSRTSALRGVTMVLGFLWGAITIWTVWRLPATDGPWPALSLIFPIYYTLLSFWLDWKSRQ
jgi:phosphatidylcholine synthase